MCYRYFHKRYHNYIILPTPMYKGSNVKHLSFCEIMFYSFHFTPYSRSGITHIIMRDLHLANIRELSIKKKKKQYHFHFTLVYLTQYCFRLCDQQKCSSGTIVDKL